MGLMGCGEGCFLCKDDGMEACKWRMVEGEAEGREKVTAAIE